MRSPLFILTPIAFLGLAVTGAAGVAHAQDTASMTVGGTTITVGGGAQYLDLPDIRFNFTTNSNGKTLRKYNDSNFDEYGGSVSGRIETPMSQWRSHPVFGAVHGFYSSLEDSERRTCHANSNVSCGYDNIVDTGGRDKFPALNGSGSDFGDLLTHTGRDVENWGFGAEAKIVSGPPRSSGLIRNMYATAGAEIRGLGCLRCGTTTATLSVAAMPFPESMAAPASATTTPSRFALRCG